MRLQHTTLIDNLTSIGQDGILVSKSKGRLKAVWLHDEAKTTWAFLHVIRRHGGRVEDVVSLTVEVDDSLVKRSAAPGLYYILTDVAPEYIRDVKTFERVSRSPLYRRKREPRR